jgi:hypothetical protein
LYSSSGIWVDSIDAFDGYRKVFVDIDYPRVCDGIGFDALVGDLRDLLAEDCSIAVSHSFGTVVQHALGLRRAHDVFICPPYLAERFDRDSFVDYLSGAVQPSERESIARVVDWAVEVSRARVTSDLACGTVVAPLDDEFFEFGSPTAGILRFRGGHAQASGALESLRKQGRLLPGL